MKSFLDIITEAFDSPVPYVWSEFKDEDKTLVKATFEIGDGVFIVQFKKPYFEPLWELTFVRNNELDLTGTGSASRVLATVMAITQAFIRDRNPSYLHFSMANSEPSRGKLYPKLAAMIASEFPHLELKEMVRRKYTTHMYSRKRDT